MRKRERDDVAAAARRRLEILSVELAELRREQDAPVGAAHDGSPDEGVIARDLAPGRAPDDYPRDKPPGPAAARRPAGPVRSRLTETPTRPDEPRVPRPRDPEPYQPQPYQPQPYQPEPPDRDGESFLERPSPLMEGPPAALLGERGVVHTPVGRPLPPDPVRVPQPGRHAVDHPGASVAEWVEDRLPPVVRGRLSLSGQHVKVLSGVLGIALVLAGWLALRSGSDQESVPQARFVAQQSDPSTSPPASGPVVGASSAPGTAASGGPSGGDVVVDVVGKVRRPGIVTLPVGSRVDDAVRRAGGLRAGARTAALNLARVLVDGEQIVVGQPAAAGVAGTGDTTGATGSTTAASPPAAAGALVNLNTAGLSELDTLPGVGPVTAQKILDWRTAHGAFSSVDELLEVDGIGDKTLADIAPRATL